MTSIDLTITKDEYLFLFFRRAAGGQIKRDYEHRFFEGGKYDNKGFLIKNFPLNAVVSINKDRQIKFTFDLLFFPL